jgi:diguanylate cyclase (GGDEF)-like protein
MTRPVATPCVLGRQLLVSVLLVAAVVTLLLTGLHLYTLLQPAQSVDRSLVMTMAWRTLLEEGTRTLVPALLLFALVNWRVILPLKRLLQCSGGVATSQPTPLRERDRNDEVTRLAGLFGDINQQLQHTRRELDTTRSWCEQLFDDAQDPLLVIDPVNATVLEGNPAAARLLTCARQDLAGQAIAALCPDAVPKLEGFLRRVQQDGSGWLSELPCRTALGDEVPLQLKASMVQRAPADVVLMTLQQLGAREDMQARIAQLAYQDALTGLPNRVLLRDRLEMVLARSQRNRTRGVVLMLDADNFKTVNDSLGHPVGDRLLQALATRIAQSLRDDDTFARLGGDEFVVLPEEIRGSTAQVLEQAMAAVDRLRAGLEQPFDLDGHEVHVTLSVGVAMYPDDGTTVDELLRRADTAMHQAKANGHNATHFYSPELEERMAQRLTMGSALRRALSNQEFVLQFQPQIALPAGAQCGCEALVRWDRPGHGRVPPLEFLPYLEEMGLMTELGFWVLDRACQYWREGREQGLLADDFRLAVNVSAGQFGNPAFVQMVRSVLEDNAMPGANLELEITEQALVKNLDGAADKMLALQAHGVSFAVDDFGTGYSSLAYLQQLPVDCLKIDRGFVQRIGLQGREASLVDVFIGIGRKLQLRVVAEGVETQQQADYLVAHGCDIGQGFLFGRPMDWHDMVATAANLELQNA